MTTPTDPHHNANAPLTYDQAGVNYDLIDPLKVAAQRAAAADRREPGHATDFQRSGWPRAASRPMWSMWASMYLASIVECLGTKTLVADEMAKLTGKSYYDGIAQDTIAMAVNDLITVGATPLVVQAYWAAGGSDWFKDDKVRANALVAGWKKACDTCRVAWGGGETPALAGIVADGRARPGRIVHRHRQPQDPACPWATSWARATPSSSWPPAASTPTACRWHASWPSACPRAT
jgi:phosphoribosylformylglycinamidine cyclo-ligase